MKEKKFEIITFGCQMNEHDSEIISGMLTDLGCKQSDIRKNADIVVINTCSIRDNADKRFFGTLGQLKKTKELRPDFVVCICGCMMQQKHVIDEIKKKYNWVDIIFGTHNIHQFPELLQSVILEKQKLVEVWENGGEIVENLPANRIFKHKALVNIVYGCNNFCTYCIVPYTRGRERSRDPEEIIKEVKGLVSDGVKEITLLGQNVNSYKGINQNTIEKTQFTDFADLIYLLNEIEGLQRIRFMTSHPKDLSDKLIQAFVDCDKLCKYIHLPVQSGSTNILKKMNRRYTKQQYISLTEKLKKACPDITISTDIIVGFPGETDEDFNETMDLVRMERYDSAFTFLYSIRKGTPAENYENQVAEEVKHERFNKLVDLLNEISADKNKLYENTIQKVLVDGVSKKNKKTLTGRTEGFKAVNFVGNKEFIGEIVDVRITEGKTFSLTGEVI